MKFYTLLTLLFVALWNMGSAQCDDTTVLINLQTGSWAEEINFEIVTSEGDVVFDFVSSLDEMAMSNEYYSFVLCLTAGCYTVNMYDSFGDGWNGAQLTVSFNQEMIPLGTLQTGSFGATFFGINDPNCVASIPGCTDMGATNYQPWATEDDGSCEYPFSCEDGVAASLYICTFSNGGQVELELTDIDGNQIINVDGLSSGTIAFFEVCLPNDGCLLANMTNNEGPYGWYGGYFWINVGGTQIVSGELSNNAQNETLAFSISGNDCPVFGCTDAEALNFNPDAVEDDGSCQYPIDCEDLTAIMAVMTTGIFPMEVSWHIENEDGITVLESDFYNLASEVYQSETCLEDGCYTVIMEDNFGDGWNGAVLELFIEGNGSLSFDLPAGSYGEGYFSVNAECVFPIYGCTNEEAINYDPNANTDDGSCIIPLDCEGLTLVTAVMTTGSFGQEVSWTLTDFNQQPVLSGNGYSNYTTYTSETCLEDGCYFLSMYDSFGDGWSGGELTITVEGQAPVVFELPSGSYGQGVVSIGTDCSEFEPTILGCTDPEAFNYNPNANEDDGSCVTSGPPNDLCEGALPLEEGTQVIDNTYAFNNVGIWGDCWNSGSGEGEQSSIWYTFTTPNDPATISIVASPDGTNTFTDTQFGLFAECGGDMIACDGNGGQGLFSAFYFDCGDLEPNTTYILVVDGWFGDAGTCLLTYEVEICGPVEGCTDPNALNYDPIAEIEDGSCTYPIECGELTTLTVTMSTAIFAFEISWEITNEGGEVVISGDGYGNELTYQDATCLEDGCYTLHMYDSFGDGWNGAMLMLQLNNDELYSFQLPSGDYDSFTFGVNSDCIQEPTPIEGCTDEDAFNYNPDATVDDGSCLVLGNCDENELLLQLTTEMWGDEISWAVLLDGDVVAEGSGYQNYSEYLIPICLGDGCYEFAMYDSFGDGWNGASFTLFSSMNSPLTGTLQSGSFDSIPFGLNTACGEEEELISGCTDPAATNFNPFANDDDGSCEYMNFEMPSGLLEAELPEMYLYPTPTSDDANVEFLNIDSSSPVIITVFDAMGRTVESNNYGNDLTRLRVQVESSTYPAGVYLVNIVNGTFSKTLRLVRQ